MTTTQVDTYVKGKAHEVRAAALVNLVVQLELADEEQRNDERWRPQAEMDVTPPRRQEQRQKEQLKEL